MKYFLISIIFAFLLPIFRLSLASFIGVGSYAYVVSIWGVASLIGSQLFGAFPRLYPDRIKGNTNEVTIDFESILFSVVLLVIYSFWLCDGDSLLMILLSVALCAIHSGLYEYYSVKSTIINKANTLFYVEMFNLLPMVMLLVAFFLFRFSFELFTISYVFFVPLVLYPFFKINKVKLTWCAIDKDVVLNKLALLIAQSNVFLLPSLMLLFFSGSFSGFFSVTYYVLNLVASFNQLLVNRVYYSDERFSFLKLTLLFSFVLIQSLIVSFAVDYGVLNFIIKRNIDSIGFIVVFVFLLSRLSYVFSFAFSRFNKVDALFSTYIESIRFILFLCGIYLLSRINYSVDDVLFLVASSYFLATFFYVYNALKVKKNDSRSLCVNAK